MSHMSRRRMLLRSAALGCSLAASPLVTPVTLASGPWDNRLVVIILRGGMDGIDVVRPVGDADYAGLGRAVDGADLDGFFALHPGLSALLPLWNAGQLSFAHAVSTPYRDRRSHFDGQDHLEAGFATPDLGAIRDGWLNRLLQTQGGMSSDMAFSVGQGEMLLLRGEAGVSNWTPEVDLLMSPQAMQLARLVMQDDPLFQTTFEDAVQIAASDGDDVLIDEDDRSAGMNAMLNTTQRGIGADTAIAKFTAERLLQETRIAAFSINGWDTHMRQDRTLNQTLPRLAQAILTLKETLGPVWGKTTVLAMTEFGRTARMNGTAGTDHGTGGLMVMAGGTMANAQVAGDWPGLAEADLYARRDVMPTADVRRYAAWAMRTQFGLSRSVLEQTVFPKLDMGTNPGVFA